MPTYEYACGACAHQWEEVQRITEAPTEVCPSCGKPTAHRLISAGTNFILKGSGWYSDLYASPKPAGASPGSGSEKKPEGKSEPSSGESSGGDGTSTSKPATESTAAPPAKPSAA